jgi:hypothetical protein
VFKDNRSVSMGFRQRQIKAFTMKKHHLLLRHINLLVISLDQSNSNPTALESLCSGSNGWKKEARFIGELKFFIYFSFSLLRVSNPLWQLFSCLSLPSNRFNLFELLDGEIVCETIKERNKARQREFNRLFHLLQSSSLFGRIFITIP